MIGKIARKIILDACLTHDEFFVACERFQNRNKPELILIGEYHTDSAHALLEAKLIQHYKPDTIVIEHHKPKPRSRNRFQATTLRQLSALEDITLEELGYDSRWLQRHFRPEEKPAGISHGITPTSHEEIVDTPFYLFDCNVQETLTSILTARKEELIKLLVGAGYMSKEEYVPQYGRHERNLSKIENIAETLRVFTTSPKNSGGKRRRLAFYDALFKSNALIIRADIDLGDFEAETRLTETSTPRLELGNIMRDANPYRERYMGAILLEAFRRKKTEQPLIGIFGDYHLRKDSGIHKQLSEHHINYRTVHLPSLSSLAVTETHDIELMKSLAPRIKLSAPKSTLQELIETGVNLLLKVYSLKK